MFLYAYCVSNVFAAQKKNLCSKLIISCFFKLKYNLLQKYLNAYV